MRLWITDGGLDFDQTGEELGNERAGGDCGVNELLSVTAATWRLAVVRKEGDH